MKKILFLFIASMVSWGAFSQTVYLADTAFTTDVGFDGAPASCVFTGGYYTGFYMDSSKRFSLADVITVPLSSTWSFDTVILYGFQDGSTTTSPFTAAYLQIYAGGAPNAGGTLVWGDTITNRLVSTGFTGIYRVDTFSSSGGIDGTLWPIMYLKLHLSPVPNLTTGTYWLRWTTKAGGAGRINCPPKFLPLRINPPSQQAMQDSSGAWYTLSYHGNHSGFNKIIEGSAAATAVAAVTSNITSAALGQNEPNPFIGNTSIPIELSGGGYVKLSVYSMTGQLVNTLYDGEMSAGSHQLRFNADDLQPGVYYYQLTSNTGVDSKRMLLK